MPRVEDLAERGDLDEARKLMMGAYAQNPHYVLSRLRGKTYFALPELGARYVAALRKAAGDLGAIQGTE